MKSTNSQSKIAQDENQYQLKQLGIGFSVLLLILLVSLILASLSGVQTFLKASDQIPEPTEAVGLESKPPTILGRVSQVFPADGSKEINPDGIITVIFDRPVVPLTTLKNQTSLPNPLKFSPHLEGTIKWLNTSVLVFQPTKPMLSGQLYRVKVETEFGELGEVPEEGFEWSFTTRAAEVAGIQLPRSGEIDPPSGRGNILPDEAITIRFSQPMEGASTEKATRVVAEKSQETPLEYQWNTDYTELTIKPKRLFRIDTAYQLVVQKTAQTQSGSLLSEEFKWNFYTLPMPKVVSVSPSDGENQKEFSPILFVKFSSPIRIDSFKENVIIKPEPKKPLEWWYNEWEYSFFTNSLEPSTQYEVEIKAGVEDIYGNKTREAKKFSFTTAAVTPYAYLRMPGETVLYRSKAELQYFYLSMTNVRKAVVTFYRLNFRDFSEMMFYQKNFWQYEPPQREMIWSKEILNEANLNEEYTAKVELATGGESIPPGLYFLTLDTPEIPHPYSPHLDQRIIIVANANLTFKTTLTEALVWATDFESGEPLANVPIQVVGINQIRLGSAVTGVDGVARITYPDTYYDGIAVAYADEGNFISYATNTWGSGATAVDYALWEGYYSQPGKTRAYVYTERPIYRPGQTVYFKAILRADDDLSYQLPSLKQVKVRIQIFDQVLWEENYRVREGGTIDGSFVLSEEAALGTYMLSVLNPTNDEVIGQLSFSVAEYRRPEFRVDVTVDPNQIVQGESTTASIKAEYYSGGPVAEGKVKWSVTAQPYVFSPGNEYRDYSFDDEDRDAREYEITDQGIQVISKGEGVLDAFGQFRVDLSGAVGEDGKSNRWVFEAEVTDIAGNIVSGRQTMIVHQSQIYSGIKPDNYLGEAGKEQSFSIVVLDWASNAIAEQVVTVDVVERRWHSVQVQQPDGSIVWETKVEEIPVITSQQVQTDTQGKAKVIFTPANGGVFRGKVCTQDKGERMHCASAYLWVYGGDFVPWRQTNDRSLQVVSDKKEYEEGDMAKILIASPFQGSAYALITVERGHIRSHEVIQMNSNSTIYSLPISPEMAPNIYVSVMVVKGVDESNPRPAFRIGLAELKVASQDKNLSISVEKDKQVARPGDEISYTLRVKDAAGNAVRAEVSVSLSDLATLSLVEPNSLPISDFFYNRRSLSVRTSSPLLLSMEDYNAFAEEDLVKGESMGSGGGKGGGALGVVEVRQEFPDTAYWKARLITDEKGEVSFKVKLPDNLTIWRLDARAVTDDTKVGQVVDDLAVKKPLMVLPKTPRFFVVGDIAEVGATVRNQTGQNLSVKVNLQAEGVEVLGPLEQALNIGDNQQVYVKWNVRVLDSKRVDLIFSALAGEWQDATKPTLATLDDQGLVVYRYESREVVATAGSLEQAGSRQETLQIPPAQIQRGGELRIRLQPSLGASLVEGLSYLENYPYACTEQTVSRFLPNVLITQAYQAAGLIDTKMQAKLDELVKVGLQKLYKQQNPDGGWGWWSTEKSDLQTSAYVMLALVEARKSKYPVDQNVFDRGKQYLVQNLSNVSALKYEWELNRQAFVLYVLARAEAPDPSRTVALYEKRDSLATYAKAYLAQTLYTINPADNRVETLLFDLQSNAIQSATGTHWQEEERDAYNWNTDSRTTAIVLSVLETIEQGTPSHENIVRWLVQNRHERGWEGTQETAWTLMALERWLESSGELEGEYRVNVAVNNRRIESWNVGKEVINETKELRIAINELLSDALNRIVFTKSNDSGRLYYTLYLTTHEAVPEIQPLSWGITVSREYFRLENPEISLSEARVGEVIYGRLILVIPNDAHHVVIEDYLPAGVEAMNQELLTTSQNTPAAKYTWNDLIYRGWNWWMFDHIELRDEKIVLAAEYLPAGTYIYTYPIRVVHVGEYQTIPPLAYEFYFPEIFGRGAGMSFRVLP